MNQVLHEHLISALQTFLATFFATVGAMLQAGHIAWTWAFWAAIILAAVRAAIKEVFARFAPIALGGRKF